MASLKKQRKAKETQEKSTSQHHHHPHAAHHHHHDDIEGGRQSRGSHGHSRAPPVRQAGALWTKACLASKFVTDVAKPNDAAFGKLKRSLTARRTATCHTDDDEQATMFSAYAEAAKSLQHTTLMTDTSRRHEWKFLFDLLDMPPGTFEHFRENLKAAYLASFGGNVPGLQESLVDDEDDDSGGDGEISFFELALFLSQQECLPMYNLTTEEITAVPLAQETLVKLSDTLELFATIKQEYLRLARARGGGLTWDPEQDLHNLYRQGISFEAFYFLMAIDELDMENREGAIGLAGNLIDMLDGSLSGEAGDGMLSRHELRRAFQGIPNLNSHSVEEFLYLFELNHEGQIEREEFIQEAKHLGVLSHDKSNTI